MSDSPANDRQPRVPAPPHPPFHVILSYVLGTFADLQVFGTERRMPTNREGRS